MGMDFNSDTTQEEERDVIHQSLILCVNDLRHVRDLSSSELSPQSLSPSHTHLCQMQRPLLHWKYFGPHVVTGQSASSLPSSQSACLSHFQLSGIQPPVSEQRNSSEWQLLLGIEAKITELLDKVNNVSITTQ